MYLGPAADSGRGVPRKGLGHLARKPDLCRILADIEVDDFSAVMAKHDQSIQDPKRRGCHNEHVDRRDVGLVVVQEASPSRRDVMARDPRFPSSLHRAEKCALVFAAALTLARPPHLGNAQVSKKLSVASLQGSWSGGGTVSLLKIYLALKSAAADRGICISGPVSTSGTSATGREMNGYSGLRCM